MLIAETRAALRSRIHSGSCVAVAVAAVLGSSMAIAQDQESVGGLEEVTVTARKQAENLQDVPLTVTAFTTETLQNVSPATLFDLNVLSPGLNYQNVGDRGGSGRLQMRGISGGTAGGAKASVFLDGVFLSGSIANLDTNNFERIEVMPGPQSAQFGRSTFAGAINYVTKDPTDEFTGRVVGTYGSLGEEEASVWLGGPIWGDKLKGAINAYHQVFEGDDDWVAADGDTKQGATRTRAFSGKLIFDPTDNVNVEVRTVYTQDWDYPGIVIYPDPFTRNIDYRPGVPSAGGPYAANSGAYFRGVQPSLQPGREGAQISINPNAEDVRTRRKSLRNTGTINWDVLDHTVTLNGGNLKETTWAGQVGGIQFVDNPVSFLGNPNYGLNKSTAIIEDDSLELRIASSQDQRLRYATGVYYERLDSNTEGYSFSANSCSTICINERAGTLVQGVDYTVGGGRTNVRTHNTTVDRSVFGALYFDLTDSWTLSYEGRYQEEFIHNRNLVVPTFRPARGTFYAYVPRYNIQFKVNDDLNFYVVHSIGNNPGGFNTSQYLGLPGTNTSLDQFQVDEEKLYNYEFGMKSLWLDRRLQVNASVYRQDWRDIQTPATYFYTSSTGTVFFGVNENRGSAQVKGGQLEVTAAPLTDQDLTLTATFSYNDGRYENFCSNNLGTLLGTGCVNVAGKKLEGVPRTTYSFGANYERPLFGDWQWFVRSDYQHQDGMYGEEWNETKSEAADMMNAHIGIKTDSINVELYCRNCNDEDSPTRMGRLSDQRLGPTAASNSTVGQVPRRPMQFGIRAAYNF